MNTTGCVLAEQDLDAVRRRYQERIALHGVTMASLSTGGEAKQRARYAVHDSVVCTPNPSILDVGCGLGLFYDYLTGQGKRCAYHGYDIVPEYVAECRKRHPEARFEVRNIFDEGIDGHYDHIFLCQVLNNRFVASDNLRVIQTAIALAFEHCRVCASIDMMSTYVDYRDEHLYYYSPEGVFAFAKRLTRRVALRHDYRGFEFCIQLFREGAPGYVP